MLSNTCVGYKLNIVERSVKIVKVVGMRPILVNDPDKFWKIHSPQCSKHAFPKILCIKWTKEMKLIWTCRRRLWPCKKFWYNLCLVKAHDMMYLQIKLVSNVKYFFRAALKLERKRWWSDRKTNLGSKLKWATLKMVFILDANSKLTCISWLMHRLQTEFKYHLE